MDILFKKKILKTINNHTELESFILQLNMFKYFKKIPDSHVNLVNLKINATQTLNFKTFKPWYRSIVNYPESVYNPKFLLMMGWESDEVSNFILEKQKKNSKILSENKKNNPEKYYDKSVKRIEYWLKKGFSEDESKSIISNSQKTFSKEICVSKFGEEKGLEIFNRRQKKWISSLLSNPNIKEFRKKQNSYLYSENNYDKMVDRSSFLETTKKVISECINTPTVELFVDSVIDKIEIKTFSDILPYVSSKIIQKKYSVNSTAIKDLFYKKIGDYLNSGYYGTVVYHNGIRFKSIKEYKLSLFLESKNIKFEYEKRYEIGKYISDFYLYDYNTYIEYFGILDGKNLENLDERQLKYYDKMINKILFCTDNKINLIYDTNFDNLIKKIKIIL